MVLCSGVFDGLHMGHLAYLRQARAMCRPGELLCVAVACNDYVRHVKHREPGWPLAERMAVVEALRDVDRVIDHNAVGVAHRVHELAPRLLVKGLDWDGKLKSDVREACGAVRCAIVFVDSGVVRHSSDALSA